MHGHQISYSRESALTSHAKTGNEKQEPYPDRIFEMAGLLLLSEREQFAFPAIGKRCGVNPVHKVGPIAELGQASAEPVPKEGRGLI